MTQAGVGLCAYKTTDQKAEAAALFVRWLTENGRNLDFVAQTGYMPVRNGAFDAIENYDKFPEPTESYRQLYAALKIMQESYTPLSEPRFEGYYGKVSQLYDGLRKMQQELPARAAAGESIDTLAEETWRCCALSIENTVMLKEGTAHVRFFFSKLKQAKPSMRRRLFLYMGALAALLLVTLFAVLLLLGQLKSPGRSWRNR